MHLPCQLRYYGIHLRSTRSKPVTRRAFVVSQNQFIKTAAAPAVCCRNVKRDILSTHNLAYCVVATWILR